MRSETVEDIIDELAAALGRTNQDLQFAGMTTHESWRWVDAHRGAVHPPHARTCGCLVCWKQRMVQRLVRAAGPAHEPAPAHQLDLLAPAPTALPVGQEDRP